MSISSPGSSLIELANRFGDIPVTRICLSPPPGHATEADLLYYADHEDRLFELIDGTLIEKAMGTYESFVAGAIHLAIAAYLKANRIGIALPADGQLRLRRNMIRVPDVAYIATDRLVKAGFPHKESIASISPNLAVEVVSESNSKKEMDDKLTDYFSTGSEEVWYVYPKTRELHQFSVPHSSQIWSVTATVRTRLLPRFELKLADVFELPEELQDRGGQ